MSDVDPLSGDALAFAVDAAVMAVRGVDRLFPADPASLRALQQVGADEAARAACALRGDVMSINVALDDVRPTREVLGEIHAAVRAITDAVPRIASIEIRVTRIHVDRL